MSRDGSVTLDFGDGTYTFRLGWAEWEMLDESLGCGPWYLQALLFNAATTMLQKPEAVKDLKPKYLSEIVRAGLIGGGMAPVQALKLVRLYVQQRPPRECFGLAMEVLRAGLDGPRDDVPADKKKERPAKPTTSRRVGSGSPKSTASELQ